MEIKRNNENNSCHFLGRRDGGRRERGANTSLVVEHDADRGAVGRPEVELHREVDRVEPRRRVQVRPDHLPVGAPRATTPSVDDAGRGRGGRGPPAAVVAAVSFQEIVVVVLDSGR